MLDHRVDELVVGERGVAMTKLGIWRALLAQQGAWGDAHAGDQRYEARAVRRRLEILDDVRFNAGVLDHRQRVARRPALRVVIDDDIDGHGSLQQQGLSSAISGAQSSAFPPQQSFTRNRVSAFNWSRSAR